MAWNKVTARTWTKLWPYFLLPSKSPVSSYQNAENAVMELAVENVDIVIADKTISQG